MTLSLSSGWAEQLLALLERQVRVYEQLRELSGRQGRFVDEGQAEPLLRLLAQRQHLIDELTRLNAELEPMRRDWTDRLAELDEPTRRRINDHVDQMQRLLREIMQQDERDRASLSGRRDQASGELRAIRAGAAVNKAYGQAAAPTDLNRYTDQQG